MSEEVTKKRKVGRPRVLSDKEKREFIGILTIGGSEADAYESLDIDRKTVKRECRRDPNFDQGCRTATARGKIVLMKRVHDACENDPIKRAGKDHRGVENARWMLERKWYKDFAARQPDNVSPREMANLAWRVLETMHRVIHSVVKDPKMIHEINTRSRDELKAMLANDEAVVGAMRGSDFIQSRKKSRTAKR